MIYTPEQIIARDAAIKALGTEAVRLLLRLTMTPRKPLQPRDGEHIEVMRKMTPSIALGWTLTPWGRIVAARAQELADARSKARSDGAKRARAMGAQVRDSEGPHYRPSGHDVRSPGIPCPNECAIASAAASPTSSPPSCDSRPLPPRRSAPTSRPCCRSSSVAESAHGLSTSPRRPSGPRGAASSTRLLRAC